MSSDRMPKEITKLVNQEKLLRNRKKRRRKAIRKSKKLPAKRISESVWDEITDDFADIAMAQLKAAGESDEAFKKRIIASVSTPLKDTR